MEIIKNETLGCELQVIKSESEIWFRGKTVAEVLGYSNLQKAISMHVREKHTKRLDVSQFPNMGDLRGSAKNQIFISEPGLYSLIMKSKKPQAEAFQDWIYEDVLPSLRKTGKYEMKTKAIMSIDDDLSQLEEMFSLVDDLDVSDYDRDRLINYINKKYEDPAMMSTLESIKKSFDRMDRMPLSEDRRKMLKDKALKVTDSVNFTFKACKVNMIEKPKILNEVFEYSGYKNYDPEEHGTEKSFF